MKHLHDKVLEVFQKTADCGSFLKAAEQLYLTHTAVIKQLNNLERRMGVQLLERSSQGVTLTPAGAVFYDEASEIIRLSKNAVQRVREAGCPRQITLRVGSSPLSPCQSFMELWQEKAAAPQGQSRFRLRIVPFSDDRQRYEHLGVDFDFLIGPCDYPAMGKKYRFFPIGRYRFGLLMRREHPLGGKGRLTLNQLQGETVLIMAQGVSPANDAIRRALDCSKLEDIPAVYNMDTFNRCAESGSLLLALECWSHLHPALVFVPLEENDSVAYGIISKKKPGLAMEEFLEALEEIFPAG